MYISTYIGNEHKMDRKQKKWSVSEARSQLSDIITLCFESPQIIVDKKTKEEKAVVVIPLSLFDEIIKFKNAKRSEDLDALFAQMQTTAEQEGYDGKSEIIIPREKPKAVLKFEE